MIDTLKLRLRDVSFSRNCDLDEKQPTFSRRAGAASEAPFLYKAGDVAVRAIGAFHNSERFNLDVSPRKFDPSIVDTTVHFSVAGVAGKGSNYHLPDVDAAHGVFAELQAWLSSIGVSATALVGVPSRCDLTKNIFPDEDYRDYQPVYAAMTPGRLEPHDYGSGYLWENTAHQIAAYSKIEEMALKAKKKRQHFDAGLYPANVQRFEWRLFGRKVKDALKVETAGDLLDAYDSLGPLYRAAVGKALFKHSPAAQRQIFTVANARAAIRYHLASDNRFWFERFWSSLPYMLLSEGEIEAIFEVVREESPNRNTPSRVKGKMAQYKTDALSARVVRGGKTAADLYAEIRDKVLAA